ncbi:MAG: tyrosine--tRNA ligase [Candidatus Kapabacteria bacterium]|jgi:tyrosyl-tRNA synthetase|nr:tyrosine--tRNA ligase [Candidatus Kapabacteria bacterium]
MFPTLNEQMDIFRSGAVDLLPEDELVKKIEKSVKTGKQMIVKLGCDPSRPDLHIGHAVVLSKMRALQDLGHKAVLIIGDFTAMIGDPTGKSKTRPQLTLEDTRVNGQTYLDQATQILTADRLEVRYNSEWLSKMDFNDVIRLAANYTVAQLLERDDFNKRFKSGTPISVHELLYPLAQAMDSVAIESDIELGGTDQKFNLLVGRDIQRANNVEPQCILTMPILEGTDGKEKMSKSLDNYIAFTDVPREMFGKVMSIPDELTVRYFRYASSATEEEIKVMDEGLKNETVHPRNAKVQVAMRIVDKYHGAGAGQTAFEEFERMFVKKDVPDDIEELTIEGDAEQQLLNVIASTKMVGSKKDGSRMIQQGAVSVDGEKVTDFKATVDFSEQRLIKVGKRKFLKVKVG